MVRFVSVAFAKGPWRVHASQVLPSICSVNVSEEQDVGGCFKFPTISWHFDGIDFARCFRWTRKTDKRSTGIRNDILSNLNESNAINARVDTLAECRIPRAFHMATYHRKYASRKMSFTCSCSLQTCSASVPPRSSCIGVRKWHSIALATQMKLFCLFRILLIFSLIISN